MGGSYSSGNSGLSGMNHHSNQMLGSISSGGYSSGSAQSNMHSRTGTGSHRGINMRSRALSSGSQSVPEIEYSDILDTLEEFSEADQSNTVYIQNHGSAGNNGMPNHGRSGSYGMQNHVSSGSVVHNQGSSSSGISNKNYQSVG